MVRGLLVRLFSMTLATRALLLVAITLLAALAASPGTAAAAPAPVATYSFDEGEGETVEDLTGDGHTATIHGAQWSTHGKYGGAMEFHGGEAEYLSIPDSPEFDFTEEFTLEAWVRPSTVENFYAPVVDKLAGGGGHTTSFAYGLYAGNFEHHPFGEIENPLGSGRSVTAPEEIAARAWTHLALTFDGSEERLYVDGELVDETTASPPVSTEGELEIGAETEHGDHYEGRIDELRVYDRVLGPAEVGLDMETPIETPRRGPVAAWSFDEGKGTVAQDLSGHGHTATISKATWTHGRFGAGLKFAGKEGECVSVPGSEDLNFTEEFTLEAWVRPDRGSPVEEPIITQEDDEPGVVEKPYAYVLLGGGEASAGAWVRKGGETGFEGIYGPEALPQGAWSHLTLTDDGARLRLYQDGQLVATRPAPPITDAHGELSIGCDKLYYAHFKGRIDEVRLYDRALTGAEVDGDMEAQVQTPKTGPIAAYSFDEGSGETVEDLTGGGHTATIQGAEWTTHGRYGGAMEFDANNEDFLSIPASTSLDGSEELTVEAWVRPETAPEYSSILMKEREGSGPRYSYALYQHDEQTSGYFEESLEGVLISPEHSLPTRAWTHIAMTDDGAWSRLYVNGELVYTTAAVPIEGHGEIRIGGNSIWGEYLDGRVDEVRIYDRSLDAAEVDADMETPLQTPKAGPVAAYSFDEGAGSVLHDVTGHGHEGTIEGPEWANGKYGGALEFDAAEGDVVTVPDSEELRLSEEFTLEAWVRPDPGESFAAVATKTAANEYGYGLASNGSVGAEQHPMGYVAYDQYVNSHAYSGGAIPTHVWTHLAVVDDGAHIRLYVNGQLVDERVSEPVRPGGGPLVIGGESLTTDAFFDGRIDELRVYGRALNGDEVATDMEVPLQTPRRGPIAAYGFDEGEGTTAEDITGDGHTGTIEGATWARGKYGDALQFDGEDDVVKVPNSPEFALTEAFTLESWVRPESESDEWAPILAKELGGGESTTRLAWWLYEAGEHAHEPYGGTEPTAGEKDYAESDDPLPVDVWSHVALTWDGSKVRLYVDGELVDCSPVVPAGAPPVTEGEVQIGAATELGDHFVGRIDEPRIYNRALTAAEVGESLAPLPHARTDEAFGVEETEAVLMATLYPQGEETEFKFEYGTTTEYGSFAPEAPYYNEESESSGQPVEVEEWVGELEPETTYHYRVVATSPRGTVFGNDQTFTTSAATLEAAAASNWTGVIGMNWNGTEEAELPGLVWESGAKIYRIPIGAVNATTGKLFLAFAQKGITLLPNVVGVPGVAPGHETQIPSMAKGSPTREAWKKKLQGLFNNYGPGGKFWEEPDHKKWADLAPEFWEMWNEENYGAHGMLNGEVSPARYGQLLEASHEVVTDHEAAIEHEVSQHERTQPKGQVKLMFGGVLAVNKRSKAEEKARAKHKPFKPGEIDHIPIGEFIRRVGHYQDYTALSLHPYAFSGNIGKKVRGIIAATRARLRKVRKEREEGGGAPGEAEKPIWVTEIGWGVKGNEPEGEKVEEDGHHILVTPDAQAKLLKETFDMMKNHSGSTGKQNYNIDAILFYNIKDNALAKAAPTGIEGSQSWDNHCGLVEDAGGVGNGHGQKRPAWETFKHETE